MKKVNIKKMVDSSNIPAGLVISTVKQFGGADAFKESASDVANHGISGGFNGFTWYSETRDFFQT